VRDANVSVCIPSEAQIFAEGEACDGAAWALPAALRNRHLPHYTPIFVKKISGLPKFLPVKIKAEFKAAFHKALLIFIKIKVQLPAIGVKLADGYRRIQRAAPHKINQ